MATAQAQETLLSDAKLHDELNFIKRHTELLASNQIQHESAYVPPLEHRHKKATLVNIPVVEPPAGLSNDDDDDDADDDGRGNTGAEATVNLVIKSLKPALTFTLPCSPTSTIASLKQQLVQQDPTAPAADQQRWILKGKAMAGERLLKDFQVQDGAVVNLMVSKQPASTAAAAVEPVPSLSPAPSPSVPTSGPPPPERHTHRSVPSLTLSFSDAPFSPSADAAAPSGGSSPGDGGPPVLSNIITSVPIDVDMHDPSPLYEEPPFNGKISDPQLWIDAFELLKRHFGDEKEGEAQLAWEAWLSGSREYIKPGQKALIRDRTGLSALGGV